MDNKPNFEVWNNSIGCPVAHVMSIIGGKWKLPIICELSRHEKLRYGQLQKAIPGITNMMLSQSLHELQDQEIIHRVQYMEVPPRVEYSLTKDGKSLLPALKLLVEWGNAHMKKVK